MFKKICDNFKISRFYKKIHYNDYFHSTAISNHSFLPLFPSQYYVNKPLEFVASKTILPLLLSIRNNKKDETWAIYQQLLTSGKLHLLTTQHFSLLLRSMNFKEFPPSEMEIRQLKRQMFSIFRQMKYLEHKPDITDYLHLLTIFSKLRDTKQCEKIWLEMIENGVVPSIYLYNKYLASCLHPRRPRLEKAKAILHEIEREQVKDNLTTLCLLIQVYIKEHGVRIAQESLDHVFYDQLPTEQQSKTFV